MKSAILNEICPACVCVVTCPDKKAHSDTLKELLNSVLTEELSGDSEEDGLTIVASMIGTGIGGASIRGRQIL